jgi:hypothetical protein
VRQESFAGCTNVVLDDPEMLAYDEVSLTIEDLR